MGTFENFVSSLTSFGEDSIRRQRQAIMKAYGPELLATMRRVSEIKNLLYRLRPAQIRDIFVEPDIADGKNTITASTLFERFCERERIVIRGSAGLGKSVLLKRYCLKHVDDDLQFAPLFLELRKIDEADASDLCLALFSAYKGPSRNANIDDFKDTLSVMGFSVLLDGFDEINVKYRDKVEAAILKFANEFPSCPIMVSGRSERSFLSWETFRVYDIKPMTENKTVELIELLDVDQLLKKKFVEDAVPKLFSNRDISFVQTPLLAILMLLTYESYADVPTKMHLFYANAFETLLRDHDLTKSLFRRPLISQLPEEEFKRLFAIFCAASYTKSKYEFSRDEIERFLLQSIKAASLDANVAQVIHDLTQSVCVMQFENLEYSFVHRSFQEYFTAVYLRSSAFEVVRSFFEAGFHPTRETVIPMLMGMDRDRIEKEWALEALTKLRSFFEGESEEIRIEGVMKNYWSKFELSLMGDMLTSMSGPVGPAFTGYRILESMYPMAGYPMWWFSTFATTQPSYIGLADSEYAVETDRQEVESSLHNGTIQLRRDVEVDLGALSAADARRFGIYDDLLVILSIVDSTFYEVKDRVDSMDEFSSGLF